MPSLFPLNESTYYYASPHITSIRKKLAIEANAKYLRVTIFNNLSSNHNIESVCNNANNNTVFLRRNLWSHRQHQHRYRTSFCRTTVYKESLFPTTIGIWNQLPEDVIDIIAMFLESFKTRIQGFA